MSDSDRSARTAAPAGNPTRRRGLLAIAALVVIAGLGYGGWHYAVGRHVESTDNAYVQGNLIQVTPRVGGTVLAIAADDTQTVQAGQTLVKLDPADAQVTLDEAEAALAQTVREVRTLYTQNSTLKAQIALREADVARLQTDVARAQDDVSRRRPLLQSGAVGKEEFVHATQQLAAARSAVAAAQSAVTAAREQLAANQVLTDDTDVEHHPNVQRAAARVREAVLALQRVEVPSPVDGVVAKRVVQLGQRVAAGAPMMSVIPLEQVWVDANFKENQLQRLRIGQPATLVADVYGDKVTFHGKVAGLGAGTGSTFSLLPAQNATGNWIKVVQRVPVRIELDRGDLAAHPLRVGLSMMVDVDVTQQGGRAVAASSAAEPAAAPAPDVVAAAAPAVQQTAVFDAANREADLRVQAIMAANLGHGSAAGRAAMSPKTAVKAAREGATAATATSLATPRAHRTSNAMATGVLPTASVH